MNDITVTIQRIESVHVALASGTADGFGPDYIGPVLQPLVVPV
jgi:hypothetical protein